jgi:mono/diheme cytochrome c family protein
VPSNQTSDNYQAIQYQGGGRVSTLGSCHACHRNSQGGGFGGFGLPPFAGPVIMTGVPWS